MSHERPNIVFFFTDDQRFDTVAALGHPDYLTPHIDALARRGCAFTQAHIPGGTCGAVCMPSRAMLHSGRTLFHLEGSGESIPKEHATLGETLRRQGYNTFGTGKWHNGHESFNRSFASGDEIFFGGMCDHWNVPAFHYAPSGAYSQTIPITQNPGRSNAVTWRSCDHVSPGKHSSRMVCDAAIKFLDNYRGEAPFFAYISFLAPHDPRTMPERFRRMHQAADMELPPNFMGGHPFDTGALHIRDEELAPFPRDPDDTRRHLAEYHAMISHLDDELGRVIRCLERRGMIDNTIVVFAGDNGLALGQHGLFGKQNCYEHSVRVPLLLAGPGIPANTSSDAYCYLLDVFPTLCELCGVPIPASVEGRSLAQAMLKPGSGGREALYFAYCQFQRAVKDGQHKLIEYVVDKRHVMTQLFDLRNDPWETHNLAAAPEHRDTLAKLRELMIRLQTEWEDKESPFGQDFWPHVPWLDAFSSGKTPKTATRHPTTGSDTQ